MGERVNGIVWLWQFKFNLGDDIGEVTDVVFYIKKNQDYYRSVVPWKFINKAVDTPRGKLENKLNKMNPKIVKELKKEGISFDSAHLAMCLASYKHLESVRQDRDSERLGPVHFSD